jgi:oligopeptidase B
MRLADDYAWLRNRDDKAVRKHLKAENSYAAAEMKASKKLSAELYREFLSRVNDTITSHPYLKNGYYYYTTDYKDRRFPVHYRRADLPGAEAEVLLDENKLARGHRFFALGIMQVSPDNRFLAYSVDLAGSENYRLFVKDLAQGTVRDLGIESLGEFAWLKDSRTFAYTTLNERYQTDRCRMGSLNDTSSRPLLIETDPGFDLSLYKSCDGNLVFIESSSKNESEVWYFAADDPAALPSCLAPRRKGHSYYPDSLDGRLYILTNLWEPDFSLALCPDPGSPPEAWTEAVKGVTGAPISGFEAFRKAAVILRRVDGIERFQILDPQTFALKEEIVPASVSNLSFWINPDPGAEAFLYSSESEVQPQTIYSFNFASNQSDSVYQRLPKGVFDQDSYLLEYLQVTVRDGSKVPLRLVRRRDLDPALPHPLWLYGYGAYGDTEDPLFSQINLSLLDRGVIYAVAGVRGGGELGSRWYDAGRMLNKKNSFTDFADVMDFLIQNNITTPGQLVIEGGSAGGLLMGAVANLAWDKCRLVIADVPFVDVLHTMLDPDLPLTVQEYEEWGDPNDREQFEYILSYSPYENVAAHPYPAMLVTAAWNDTRVGYWEAAKWVQKLRRNTTSANPILLRILWDEGHTGTYDLKKNLRYYADTIGYALWLLGIHQ